MYDIQYHSEEISKYSFLVTGGAGFIGSNLVEYLLKFNAAKVRVLDNFSTGFRHNIEEFLKYKNFELIEGDIRIIGDCKKSVKNIDYVLHQAALGSVPRSIADPITTNEVNISGFLNMIMAVRDSKVKRFVYAASSSTYGDSKELPKIEERIGKPLSPYAVTKYVNELYADVFSKTFGIETVGLRYFNVFGQRQNPDGAYAAVIPKFVMQLMKHESPIINGDGEYSRDFTYIENVVQANILAAFANNSNSINQVYNVAYGERSTLNQLTKYLKQFLSEYDEIINTVEIKYGPNRLGDVAHSLASIEKATKLLNYKPYFNLNEGLKNAVKWYWVTLK
jgi:UDP-N-acetylglucosamine/UDP-N-acetylgalactosamine 4-epimerase